MPIRPSTTTVTRIAAVAGAQSVPLGGVLGADWTATTGLALYWIESLALALVASLLAWLVTRDARRGFADTRGGEAPGSTDQARRHREVAHAKIAPGDVFGFHVVSLFVFGLFLSGVLFIFSQKTDGISVDAEALLWGGMAMVGFVAIGAARDVATYRRLPAAEVAARVDACSARWALFWTLGFFGPILVYFFGRPEVFLLFFGGLKALWEVGRLIGRRSPPVREPALYP